MAEPGNPRLTRLDIAPAIAGECIRKEQNKGPPKQGKSFTMLTTKRQQEKQSTGPSWCRLLKPCRSLFWQLVALKRVLQCAPGRMYPDVVGKASEAIFSVGWFHIQAGSLRTDVASQILLYYK